MARPRVYVNRHGRPVKSNTGVSFNRVRRRFYIIPASGKRQEYRSWEEARAALIALEADALPPGKLERIVGAASVRRSLALDYLAKSTAFAEVADAPVIEGFVVRGGSLAAAAMDAARVANELADVVGIPKQAVREVHDGRASGPKLSEVIAKWTEHKAEERGVLAH